MKGHVAIADGAAWASQLPPLTRFVGDVNRIDRLVEDGELAFGRRRLWISDGHGPGAKPLLTPHKSDLSLAQVEHDARLRGNTLQRHFSSFSRKGRQQGTRQHAAHQHRNQRPPHETRKTH